MENQVKIFFVDFLIHSLEEITQNISRLEKGQGVMIRKYKPPHCQDIEKIVCLCKARGLKIFSHFENKNFKNFTHFASSNKKTSTGDCSISFHNIHDLKRLKTFEPAFIFLSPVFQTKTHPDAKPLGIIQVFKISRQIKHLLPRVKIILLGGMNQKRFKAIKKMDYNDLLSGYGGIRDIF